MLSKNKIKYIQSLHKKKARDKEELFIVEGYKMVEEALRAKLDVSFLFADNQFLLANKELTHIAANLVELEESEIKKISLLQNPQSALAVVSYMNYEYNAKQMLANPMLLALDDIQDPGNLGTIIRTADWFGITDILCSKSTVDRYNPKVIQSSMGAIYRVRIHYVDLALELQKLKEFGAQIHGAFLEGDNIYQHQHNYPSVLVLGNEGNGISKEVEAQITKKVHIPSFASSGSESLNVASATAILCSEFMRNKFI